jgi:flagellar basal-body rod protein FlgB
VDKGIQLLEGMIKNSVFRHKVLASNIANADTPGYKAKDVSFRQEMDNSIIKMAQTNPDHMPVSTTSKAGGRLVPVERTSWEDGNNVTLDIELANMTENALLYEAGVRLLSKKLQMYKNAVRGR